MKLPAMIRVDELRVGDRFEDALGRSLKIFEAYDHGDDVVLTVERDERMQFDGTERVLLIGR